MTIISILNQKGGCGKTTLAINLARAIQVNEWGDVLLVDSDYTQASAREWNTKAQGELLTTICIDRETIGKDIQPHKKHYDYIVIDGVPALCKLTTETIKCSDIIVIPIQPSPLDLWATINFLEQVASRIQLTDGKLIAVFVITRTSTKTILYRDVKEILEEFEKTLGIKTLKTVIIEREDYKKCLGRGSTILEEKENHPAQGEIQSLAEEIRKLIK